MAFLTLLERLAPEERATFLLHDVFEVDHRAIASVIGRSEAACRQVVHRARERVRGERKAVYAVHTEAVTRVGDTHVPDDVYARVSRLFDEDEMVALTFAVVVINAWNRLAVSFRVPPGSYQLAQTVTA